MTPLNSISVLTLTFVFTLFFGIGIAPGNAVKVGLRMGQEEHELEDQTVIDMQHVNEPLEKNSGNSNSTEISNDEAPSNGNL